MKPAYSSVFNKKGLHLSGVCKIELIPLPSLKSKIAFSFIDRTVKTNILTSYPPLVIEFTPNSCKHQEKIKSTKAGDFYDIIVQGLCNNIDSTILQILETLRFEKFVVLITNVEKDALGKPIKIIIGNNADGMKLQYSIENNNATKLISIDLSFTSEYPSPYYKP